MKIMNSYAEGTKAVHVLTEQPSAHYDSNGYRSPVSRQQERAMYVVLSSSKVS